MTEAKRTNSKGERFRQCVSGGRDIQREDVLHSGSQRAGRKGPLLHSLGTLARGRWALGFPCSAWLGDWVLIPTPGTELPRARRCTGHLMQTAVWKRSQGKSIDLQSPRLNLGVGLSS